MRVLKFEGDNLSVTVSTHAHGCERKKAKNKIYSKLLERLKFLKNDKFRYSNAVM